MNLISILIILFLITIISIMIWYIRIILKKLLFISDNINGLLILLEKYKGFLNSVHSLEMFYGEPVLQELIMFTKQIIENVKQFEDIYDLTGIKKEEEEQEETEEDKQIEE